MRTDIFEKESKELDFVVNEIKFKGLVKAETENITAVKEVVDAIDLDSVASMDIEEAKDAIVCIDRTDSILRRLCQDSLDYIGQEKIEEYRKYSLAVRNRLEGLEHKRSRKQFVSNNKAELFVFILGCVLTLVYSVFSIVTWYKSFSLIFILPAVSALIIAPDLKQLKKFKFIPILVAGLVTALRFILRLINLSGGTFNAITLFDLLPIVVVIIVSICAILRKRAGCNGFHESMILAGGYAVWSAYLYLLFNIAPMLIAYSPWHALWFFPASFSLVNLIVHFIEEASTDIETYSTMTINITSCVFVLALVLFAGAYGLEFIPIVAVVIAEAVAGNIIVHRVID